MPCKLDTLRQLHEFLLSGNEGKTGYFTVKTEARQGKARQDYYMQLLTWVGMACNSSRAAFDTWVVWEAHM